MSDLNRHPLDETLHAFLDGELDEHEHRRVEEHVLACARCEAAVTELQVLFGDLSSLRLHQPGTEFEARVMARVSVPAVLPWRERARARLAGWVMVPEHPSGQTLQELADTGPSNRRLRRAEKHARGCTACAGEVSAWESLFGQVSSVDRFDPREGFADRVLEGVALVGVPATTLAAPARSRTRERARAALAAIRRTVPRSRRAWAAISGAAVTPAVTMGLVLWAVFSHPTATPGALASFALWQLTDLFVAAWSGLVTMGLAGASAVGLDGVLGALAGAPLLVAVGLVAYTVGFAAATRILYKNVISNRYPRHRYASASVS